MSRHSILSNTQREAILTAQFDLEEREVARYWTLSDQDVLRIDRRRRDSNRFGFAVQLCPASFPRLATEWEHITLTGSFYWRQYKSDINILGLSDYSSSPYRPRQRRTLF